jgi:hypothetical protein
VVNSLLLGWSTVWKHMRYLTGKEIEKRAVMALITYYETQIDQVILQSIKEMEQLNEFKKVQGIYQKVRITDECIKQAIKTINTNNHSQLLEKAGGKKSDNKKEIETHLKEENILTEVT